MKYRLRTNSAIVFSLCLTISLLGVTSAASASRLPAPNETHNFADICTTRPAGLISWWQGNGNPSDMVSANNGTLMNEATYAAGKIGQAFSLDGVDDYVSLPKVPAWDFGSGSFSISAWFKTDAGDRTDYRQIIRYDTGMTPSGAWGVDVTPEQKIRFGIARNGDRISDDIISTNAFADDVWHLVTAVRDAEEGFLKLYIDGSPAAADVVDRDLNVLGENNTPLLIGAAGWGAGYFPGLIDEVMVAGRAFTANEISALYAAGSAGVCGSHVYLPIVIK